MSETIMSETRSESLTDGPIQDEIREPLDSLLPAVQVDGENGFDTAATVPFAEEQEDHSGDGPLVDRLVRRQLAVIEDLEALDERILGLLTTWQRERPAA